MNACAVSVVIPLHNAAAHVGAALDTVAAQVPAAADVIVIDDGSTDGGGERVAARGDARVRLITQPNRGVSAARNAGLAAATQPWVAFLDADDLWCPGHLARLAALAERFPEAGVLGERFRTAPPDARPEQALAVEPGEARPRRADFVAEAAAGRAPFYTSSCMVRRDAALAAGGFPEGASHGEDLSLWITLSERHGAAATEAVGALYRQGGALSARARRVPDAAMMTLERLAAEAPPARRAVLLRLRRRIALSYALTHLAAGNRAGARAALTEARGLWSARRLAASLLVALPAPVARAAFAARTTLRGEA